MNKPKRRTAVLSKIVIARKIQNNNLIETLYLDDSETNEEGDPKEVDNLIDTLILALKESSAAVKDAKVTIGSLRKSINKEQD